jgi:hypothetical protein
MDEAGSLQILTIELDRPPGFQRSVAAERQQKPSSNLAKLNSHAVVVGKSHIYFNSLIQPFVLRNRCAYPDWVPCQRAFND